MAEEDAFVLPPQPRRRCHSCGQALSTRIVGDHCRRCDARQYKQAVEAKNGGPWRPPLGSKRGLPDTVRAHTNLKAPKEG